MTVQDPLPCKVDSNSHPTNRSLTSLSLISEFSRGYNSNTHYVKVTLMDPDPTRPLCTPCLFQDLPKRQRGPVVCSFLVLFPWSLILWHPTVTCDRTPVTLFGVQDPEGQQYGVNLIKSRRLFKRSLSELVFQFFVRVSPIRPPISVLTFLLVGVHHSLELTHLKRNKDLPQGPRDKEQKKKGSKLDFF